MLIQWGLDKARDLKLPAYLEASTTGYKLYAKHGFLDIAKIDLDLAEWGGEGITSIVLMLRNDSP